MQPNFFASTQHNCSLHMLSTMQPKGYTSTHHNCSVQRVTTCGYTASEGLLFYPLHGLQLTHRQSAMGIAHAAQCCVRMKQIQRQIDRASMQKALPCSLLSGRQHMACKGWWEEAHCSLQWTKALLYYQHLFLAVDNKGSYSHLQQQDIWYWEHCPVWWCPGAGQQYVGMFCSVELSVLTSHSTLQAVHFSLPDVRHLVVMYLLWLAVSA